MTAVANLQGGRTRITLTSNWTSFVLRRVIRLVVSLFALMTATFLMIQLVPGDPVRVALGPTAPASLVAAMRRQLGLDAPLWQQYANYINGVLHGNLGTSIALQLPVSSVLGSRLEMTGWLVGQALLVMTLISVPLGIWVGVVTRQRKNRTLDLAFNSASGLLNSIPQFLLGVLLVAVFSVGLKMLPVASSTGWTSSILPTLAIALGPAASLARMIRVETRAVLSSDYMLLVRAKRLPKHLTYIRHLLPNVITGALTLSGLLFGVLIASTVVVENIFAWPGVGTVIVQGITDHDYPMVQGSILVLGAAVLVVNLAVDVGLMLVDRSSVIRER